RFEVLGGDFLARLDINPAGFLVDEIARRKAAEDLLGRDQQFLKPVLRRLVGAARADLLAGGEDHFARPGVDDIEGRLAAAPLLGDERQLPAAPLNVVPLSVAGLNR